MDNQQATDIELGWLAGILDGEGWIGMTITHDQRGGGKSNRNRKTVKLEIRVNNCDSAIIDKTSEILRKLGTNPYQRTYKASAVKRLVYECAIKNMTNAEKVLVPMQPILVGDKQLRAELMLKFIQLRRANKGVPNPAYANGLVGWHGTRTLRPYSTEELEVVEACRNLQSRGASETTREKRDEQVRRLRETNARRLESSPVKI